MTVSPRLLFIVLFPCFVFSQEVDISLTKLKDSLALANNEQQKVNALLKIGNYQIEKEIKRAEQHFLDALKIIDNNAQKDFKRLRARTYVGLGVVNRRKGDYTEAVDYYFKAKKIYEDLNDISNIADVTHNIAMVHRYKKDYPKAIKGFKQSIRLKESVKDTFGIAAGYNMLGVAYRRNKQLDSAFICYHKAKHLFTLLKSESDVIGVDSNLAVLYSMQKEYDKSLSIKENALRYHKRKGNKLSIAIAYYNISSSYKSLKDYKTSLKYADSSLIVAKEGNFKEDIMRAYLRKSFVNSKLKNFKDAYYDYRIFNRYSDTIFNIENAKKIQALELNYEFEKEKEVLEALKEQEQQKKNLYFALFFIALLSGIIVSYLVWKNYKNRVKITAKELENEKLQKELLNQKVKVSEAEIKSLVADNTMRTVFKKEFLGQLSDEMKASSSKEVKVFIKMLKIKFQEQIRTEDKLSKIHKKVEAVNKGFEDKLVRMYPELSKNQRDFCMFLRLNLSMKEIASIKNTTISSVKSMRHRIRAKLDLKPGEELEQFIQSL